MPRPDGDGIAVDIPTRAGLVTVVFTGRGHARATPAAGGAFTYRGRGYTGGVFLSGPDWRASSGLGLSLHPAGGPAGPGVAGTIAAIIGAAVAAHLREHPEIPGQASQARAQVERAWAVRDLELLTVRIIAAERQLAGLRREEAGLRAIAGASHQPPRVAEEGIPPAGDPAAGDPLPGQGQEGGCPGRAGPGPGACRDPGPAPAAPGRAGQRAVFDVTAGGLRHRLAPGLRAVRDLSALTSETLSTEMPCCGRQVTLPIPGPGQARPAFCCHCRALFAVGLMREEPDGFGGDPPHVAIFEAERLDVTVARHRAGKWDRYSSKP